MTTKATQTVHVRLGGLKAYAKKRCAQLNKVNKDLEQKWDISKYIRWLIRQDMKGKFDNPQADHVVPQNGQVDTTEYYDSLLNQCYRR